MKNSSGSSHRSPSGPSGVGYAERLATKTRMSPAGEARSALTTPFGGAPAARSDGSDVRVNGPKIGGEPVTETDGSSSRRPPLAIPGAAAEPLLVPAATMAPPRIVVRPVEILMALT